MLRGGQVAAQAQAQRQEEINAVESAELVKALLRVATYHVSYLRGIFPEDAYRVVDMKNLDNLEVRMLTRKTEETARLMDWVEGGVADALARRYLRKLFFGFSKDAEGKELLEEYVFHFSYDVDGTVHMAAGGRSKHKFSTKEATGGKCPSLGQVKYQVVRLMRMLVEVTNTLEQVPDERYLFMKLTYTDDTPDEYEPPFFGPAADGGVACFSRMPFVMEIGRVDTKHINVGLAVKSLLDTVDGWEEDMDVPIADDNSNLFQPTTTIPALTSNTTEGRSMGGDFSCAGSGRNAANSLAKDCREVQQVQAPSKSGATTEPVLDAGQVEDIQAWVLGRPLHEVHFLDALVRFNHLPSSSMDAVFAVLQRRGVLVPANESNTFKVVQPPTDKPGDAATPQPEVSSPADAALMDAAKAMERLNVGMHSQQGGLHEAPGSQHTLSVAGKRKALQAESETAQQQQLLFPDTQQQSQAGGKRFKKASMVEQPIGQGKAGGAGTALRRSARNLR